MKNPWVLPLAFYLFMIIPAISAQPDALNYVEVDRKIRQLPSSLTFSTETIASFINDNFKNDDEKVRAVYTWITTNLTYDTDRMFYSSNDESERDKISETLKERKGICEDYTAVFQDLCNKTGIKCYIIEGYTKQFGSVDQIPHSWCAAFIDNDWYMFDPTWGSGYVNQQKFIREFNAEYFKVKPSVFIQTHIPFDHLWQFLPAFTSSDSILAFERLDKEGRARASIRRIEQDHIKNELTRERLKYLKQEAATEHQNKIVRQYNIAVKAYNDGISHLNAFIQYKNKQFTPIKPDQEIRTMINMASDNLNQAYRELLKIKYPDPANAITLSSLQEACTMAISQVKVQEEWLSLYLQTENSERRKMFYRTKSIEIQQ